MYRIILIIFLLLVTGCNKDEDAEKFTSMNGFWIVRTPDSQTTLTFNIAQDQDNITLINRVSVVHDGTDFNTKIIQGGIISIPPRRIESLTFTNNSFEVPYLVIRLTGISINEDFTEMQIENSSFNVNGEFRQFPMIVAERH